MTPATEPSRTRTLGRWLLGGFLAAAGTAHLTVAREEFQAQVPDWLPVDPDPVVIGSGLVELGLGLALWVVVLVVLFPIIGWSFLGLGVSPALIVASLIPHVLFAVFLWGLGRLMFKSARA